VQEHRSYVSEKNMGERKTCASWHREVVVNQDVLWARKKGIIVEKGIFEQWSLRKFYVFKNSM